MKNSNSILNIPVGKTCTVKEINGDNLLKKRLNSLGIIKNSTITIYKKALFGDPVIIKVNNSTIALRKKIFKNIIIN